MLGTALPDVDVVRVRGHVDERQAATDEGTDSVDRVDAD